MEWIVVGLIREDAAPPERCERILARLDQQFTVDAGHPFVDVTLAAESYESATAAVAQMMADADPDWRDCFRFGKR